MDASLMGHPTTVNMLMSAGANINATDVFGWTALELSQMERRVRPDHRVKVMALLEGDRTLDRAQDTFSFTALDLPQLERKFAQDLLNPPPLVL